MSERQLSLELIAQQEAQLAAEKLLCEQCRFEYPLTTEYWLIDGDLVKQPCLACQREEHDLMIVPDDTPLGEIAGLIASQVVLTPGIQQLSDNISQGFGGVEGIANFVRREFHLAPGGSQTRFKYLKMITDIIAQASEQKQRQTNLDLFTNEDLAALLKEKLKKVAKDVD